MAILKFDLSFSIFLFFSRQENISFQIKNSLFKVLVAMVQFPGRWTTIDLNSMVRPRWF
jgi:hypothetical protein